MELKETPDVEIIEFEFIDAKIPLHDKREYSKHLEKVSLNITPVVQSAVSMIHTIFADMTAGKLKPVHMYRWNLYEQLSLAAGATAGGAAVKTIPNLSFIDKHVYSLLIWKLYNLIKLPFENCKLIYDRKQPTNLFMDVNTKHPYIPEYKNILAYKIHLITLPDYILYTFCKLTLLQVFPYCIQTKMNLNSRHHLPTPRDTDLLVSSGGATPTFVIYAGMDPSFLMLLLHSLHIVFKDDEDIIGGMITTDAPTVGIPGFNVRINRLIAYASGDRGQKLKARFANVGAAVKNAPPKGTFKKPDWIAEMQAACSDKTKDEINKDALLWFGHELCDATGKQLPDPNPCGICYMTSKEVEPMVTPRLFKTEMKKLNNTVRAVSGRSSNKRKSRRRRF